MRRLVLSVLLAITVFILPSVSYSMDADYKQNREEMAAIREALDQLEGGKAPEVINVDPT